MNDTGRLEAFSDGVLAIIITIMVLQLEAPDEATLAALWPLLPSFLGYLLSFIYIGIYWNNHHHLFQITQRTNGSILWANLNLLFWLSLFPFATAWMGSHSSAAVPTALYGGVLLMAALAWWLLLRLIINTEGSGSLAARAMRRTWKEKISPLLYLAGIGLAFAVPRLSELIYAVVAIIWIIPDRRIERALTQKQAESNHE